MACSIRKKIFGEQLGAYLDELARRYDNRVERGFSDAADWLSRTDEKATKAFNRATGLHFRNLFAVHEVEKQFSEWIREMHIQRNEIYASAKRTREQLAALGEEESAALVQALGGDIDPAQLPAGLQPVYASLRKIIDDNARELVELGVLKEDYVIDDYLKRYYSEFVENQGRMRMWFDKRFKARKDMTHDERIAAGMIEDASFVIPNTIAEQRIQALKAQMLKGISERFGKDEEAEGYVRVPDDTIGGGIYRYGALAGKFVPEEVFKALRETSLAKENMGFWENVMYPVVDHIKVNVTVKNPATHIYNIQSNILMAYLHGDMLAVGRVLNLYAKDRPAFDALVKEANVYGLNTLLNDIEGDVAFAPNGKPHIAATIFKNLYASADSTVGKALRKTYTWEDKLFKLAAFENNMREAREILGRELTEAEKRRAFKEANEAYVDYDTPLPAAVRGVDKGGVMPFLHYTWKSTPVVAKAIAKHPLRFALLQLALIGLGASSWFGGDDDEITKPTWAEDQLNLVGAKEWVDLGNGWHLNAGRLIPGAKLGSLDFQAGFVGGIVKIVTGQTPLGYDYISKYDSGPEAAGKGAATLAENYAPPLSPFGRYGQRLERKALGDGRKNSSTGEEMSTGEIIGQAVGVRRFDPKREAQRRANAIENKYKYMIKNGQPPRNAAQTYMREWKELMGKARRQGIVGLDLDATPPRSKKQEQLQPWLEPVAKPLDLRLDLDF